MKKFIVTIFTVAAIFSGVINVTADSWVPPVSFEIQSEHGNEVFRFEPDATNMTNTYSKSAVYKSADAAEPIYTVKNLRSWAYKSDFFFSENFRQFAFIPPADFDLAMEFYSNGRLIKKYNIKELVKDHSKITRSISSAWWRNTDTEIFQDQNTLQITTVDNLTYTFDIATGDILQNTESLKVNKISILKFSVLGIVGVGIIGVAIFWLIRRKRKS